MISESGVWSGHSVLQTVFLCRPEQELITQTPSRQAASTSTAWPSSSTSPSVGATSPSGPMLADFCPAQSGETTESLQSSISQSSRWYFVVLFAVHSCILFLINVLYFYFIDKRGFYWCWPSTRHKQEHELATVEASVRASVSQHDQARTDHIHTWPGGEIFDQLQGRSLRHLQDHPCLGFLLPEQGPQPDQPRR